MDENRVVVPLSELEAAFAVWLKTVPPRVWNAYAAFMLKRIQKRDNEDDRVDPRDDVVRHFVKHFDDANWEVTRKPKGNLFG
jgi:hypothetical protein